MTSRTFLLLVIAGCAVAAAAAAATKQQQHQHRIPILHELHELHDYIRDQTLGKLLPGRHEVPSPVTTDATAAPQEDKKTESAAPGSNQPQPAAERKSGCAARQYKYGPVCVCDDLYCDVAPSEPAGGVQEGHFMRVVSTADGRRLDASEGDMIYRDRPRPNVSHLPTKDDDIVYAFNPLQPRQRIQGFGGAVTDSAAADMLQLSDATRSRLLRAYFGDDGSRYQFVRVPMGGSDFSTRVYSYDDNNGVADPSLANFSLAQEDLKLKIPILLEAQKAASQPLKLFTAPWGAPNWMVNTHKDDMNNLKEEYQQTWADYFVKFLDAYKSLGLPFWGLSTQNEPSDGYVVDYGFNKLGWSPEALRQWLADYLIPTLKKKESGVKIMIHDDQRSRLPDWPARTLNDSTVRDAVDGIAVHWYEDATTDPALLTETHNLFPEKFLLYTEACDGPFLSGGEPVQLGNWTRGVNYARDIIQTLNNWVTGWVDWNLALNVAGGPSWASNNLDAAIIVNATADEFYKQPTYYAIQHFSRYIPPGSFNAYLQPIATPSSDLSSDSSSGSDSSSDSSSDSDSDDSSSSAADTKDAPNVSAAAFLTPQGRFVIVFLNEDEVPRTVAVTIGGIVYYRDTLAPHSIQTTVAHPRPAGT